MGNPFNLPIADIELSGGFAVVEHCIFRGKDLGYRIIVGEGDLPALEIDSLPCLPPKSEAPCLPACNASTCAAHAATEEMSEPET
jgi:hypothetical protein